jgi:hypothetical protein
MVTVKMLKDAVVDNKVYRGRTILKHTQVYTV